MRKIFEDLSDAFNHHDVYELATFFEFFTEIEVDCQSRFKVPDTPTLKLEQLMKPISMLAKSTHIRRDNADYQAEVEARHDVYTPTQEELDDKENMSDEKKVFRRRVNKIAFEYLLMSAQVKEMNNTEIMVPSVHEDTEHYKFAQSVSELNRLGLDNPSLLKAMLLMMKAGFTDQTLTPKENKEYNLIKERRRKLRAAYQDYKKRYEEIIEKGPLSCPQHLHDAILHSLGYDVKEVWDLRELQDRIYVNNVQTFVRLVEKSDDHKFIERLPNELEGYGALGKKIEYVAGGCGPAKKEIAFCKALQAKGIDVQIHLVDKSYDMLQHAVENCRKAGITNFTENMDDLRTLNLKKFHTSGSQVMYSLFGGTQGNLPDKYDTLNKDASDLEELPSEHAPHCILSEASYEKDIGVK